MKNLLFKTKDGIIIFGQPVGVNRTPRSFTLENFADDPRGFRGVNYATDYGTTYNLLVDATGGGDYITVDSAVQAASTNDVIAIKGHGTKYRELVNVKSNITIQAHGTDRPEITAFENLGTGIRCDSLDDSIIGSGVGATGNIWKWTNLSTTQISYSNLLGLNLREADIPLYIATDRAKVYSQGPDRIDSAASRTPYRIREDNETYYNADSYGSSIIYDSSVINTTRYTDSDLLNARVVCHVDPNIVNYYGVTASDTTNNNLTISGSPSALEGGNPYAILNSKQGLIQGSWMFRAKSGNLFDVYAYLYDSNNSNEVEFSARKTVFELPTTTPTNITIQGLHISGASGNDPNARDGAAIRRTSNGSNGSNIVIRNNLISDCDIIGYNTVGGVWLIRCDSAAIEYNTFRNFPNSRGTSINGSLVDVVDGVVRRNVFDKVAFAQTTFYNADRPAFLHNYCYNGGGKAHSNLVNHYISGQDFLVWANEFDYCQGYITWQSISNPYIACNWVPSDQKYDAPNIDNRVIVDQGGSGDGLIFNNSALVVRAGATSGNHMAIDINSGPNWTVYNNIAHGVHPLSELPGTPVGVKSNLVTHNGYAGSTAGNLDASDFDSTNTFDLTLSNSFLDYSNRDWRDAGNIASITGQDMTSQVNTLKGLFGAVPDSDLDTNFLNDLIIWTDLKVGASFE